MSTLYLTENGARVGREADCLVVYVPENKEQGRPRQKIRIPLIRVSQVVVLGNVTLTTPALWALLEQRVEICFCTGRGRFLGRLTPPMSKNSLVRLEQHRAHNDPVRAFMLARGFVWAKLSNMRTMLLRANRKREDATIAEAADHIGNLLEQLKGLEPDQVVNPSRPQAGTAYGSLLGIEGAGTAAYFGVFGRLLRDDWGFPGRQKRPPPDPVNALLSFGYVVLMNYAASAVHIVGLDPYVGFLHSSQYGKPALALDVMEPFRPLIVDSVVLTLLNNRMIAQGDFIEELGSWRLTDEARRLFLTRLEERLDTEVEHPVLGYKTTYRRALELEVRLLAKWLMGEVPRFRAFTVR
ncbi:MAG: type I-D CRISPR-associated endonuclease Cas1d [Anaerolineae bacterium]|nr:type I-D CRISPR-associated endonuclease Cas1d [Anaerolineae bacterium]MDW7992456.1 type I-D CRISPR-associated endonuclease Cas1d [Anaerolineae bacterium]